MISDGYGKTGSPANSEVSRETGLFALFVQATTSFLNLFLAMFCRKT